MSQIVVAVTGINSCDNPGPGVGVARSLKEAEGLDVLVVGLAYDAMETGIYLDWIVDRAFIVPYPSAGPDALLARLRYIKATVGLDFVMPNLDVELPLYARIAAALSQDGIGTFLPTPQQFRERGKDQLAAVAESMGLGLPRTHVVSSIDALSVALAQLAFPVMVKGAHYKAWRAHTWHEAVGLYHTLVAEVGAPVIVQEVVSGEELNLVGVGDGDGGVLGLVGAKKMGTTALGKMWTAVTIDNPVMLDAARRFAAATRWRGAFELECMADGATIRLIEINPRFPAWTWFATAAGVNLPARLLRHALGQANPPVTSAAAGQLCVRYTAERVTDMRAFQKMATTGET